MRTNLTLTALILLLAVVAAILAGYIAANAGPAHEGCGTFGDPQFHCTGGDCENGVLDPFRLDVPNDKVVCAVDWYFAGKTAPTFTHVSNGCSFGLCVFGMPFGQLRAFSSPHDSSVTGLRVWTEPREKRHAPMIMRDYPYPYPAP